MNEGARTSGSVAPRPKRFLLSPGDVAAGFHAAGTTPPKSAFYDGLPPPSRQLPKALTDGASGALSAEANAVFRILAHPQTIVSLETVTPPSPVTMAARFVGGASPGQFAMIARPQEEEWDIALLTGTGQLLALLDELTGASTGPSTDSPISFDLNVAALTALAALADQAAKCEALERLGRPGLLLEFLTAPVPTNELVDAIGHARAAPTTLQAVTLLSLLTSSLLEAGDIHAQVKDGMEILAGQGILREDSTLTPAGVGLCRNLVRVRTGSSLQIINRHATEPVLDRFLLLRTDAGLLVGLWMGSETTSATLKLRELTPGTLWRIVGNSTGDGAASASAAPRQDQRTPSGSPGTAKASAAPKQFCACCGRELRPLARFCTMCGAQIAQP